MSKLYNFLKQGEIKAFNVLFIGHIPCYTYYRTEEKIFKKFFQKILDKPFKVHYNKDNEQMFGR